VFSLAEIESLPEPRLAASQEFDAGAKHARSEDLSVSLARWPGAAPFALFLSHDVDQIHDRELFRLLADVNHVRRCCFNGENGNVRLALRRIGRSILRPKAATRDFETLVELEARYGFRSTFFLLHDRYWARHGSRYSFGCTGIRDVAKTILAAGSELGVHGGYYQFNNAALYRESIEAVVRHFGVRPCGIRNHLLRFSGADTWLAQSEAGFAYDATYGWPHQLGPRDGSPLPFFARDPAAQPGPSGIAADCDGHHTIPLPQIGGERCVGYGLGRGCQGSSGGRVSLAPLAQQLLQRAGIPGLADSV
jgi:hypothetical protein